MEIIWSKRALNRLDEIWEYIAQDSPNRATSFVDELILSVEQLALYPKFGSFVRENPVFRQLIHQGYRLIYFVHPNLIEIVTVIPPCKNEFSGGVVKKRRKSR